VEAPVLVWNAIRSLFNKVRGSQEGLRRRSDETGTPCASPGGIVALLASEEDRNLLRMIAAGNQLGIRFANSSAEVRDMASQVKAAVILCDRDLPGTQWRELVHLLASVPQQPLVILLSRVIDEYLWEEVIRNGGYDILPKPLQEDEVLRSIKLACSYWNAVTNSTHGAHVEG